MSTFATAVAESAERLERMGTMARAVLADIAEIRAERVAEYRAALNRFDWLHEQSDDYSVYLRGQQALRELRDMQAEVDPSGEIWRAHRGAKLFGAPGPRGMV